MEFSVKYNPLSSTVMGPIKGCKEKNKNKIVPHEPEQCRLKRNALLRLTVLHLNKTKSQQEQMCFKLQRH